MLEIVDGHGHIFPPLWEACGFPSAELHALFMQYAMHTHGNQPVRRLSDHAIVEERHLWDPDDPSETGRAKDVDFRAAPMGRFRWQKDGVDYYVQFLPPNLQDMQSPAEFMIAQMDYAGIRTLVLQNDHIYGDSAALFADAMARYPGRFIGLAQVEEAFAYRDDQIAKLRREVEAIGMAGLYFTMSGFFRNGYREYYTDDVFGPFWEEVRRLGLPVFWVFPNTSPIGDFGDGMRLFRGWLERFPDIPSVLVHGLPSALFAGDDDVVRWPEDVVAIMEQFPVFSELLYPISWGRRYEYPYVRAQHHARQLFERFGAGKLIWGADMPNVERYCTYRQSLTWILDRSPWLGEGDRRKVFHDNALGLFRGSAGRRDGA
jgi:predicted TIM-barrel fold metal-dependent hydrolase